MPYRKKKPMQNEKMERNLELYILHLKNPTYSYAKLGDRFSVTRQRAFRIVKTTRWSIGLGVYTLYEPLSDVESSTKVISRDVCH